MWRKEKKDLEGSNPVRVRLPVSGPHCRVRDPGIAKKAPWKIYRERLGAKEIKVWDSVGLCSKRAGLLPLRSHKNFSFFLFLLSLSTVKMVSRTLCMAFANGKRPGAPTHPGGSHYYHYLSQYVWYSNLMAKNRTASRSSIDSHAPSRPFPPPPLFPLQRHLLHV